MYKINIFWLSLALGMHRTWQKRDFPNRPEYSLMTRSNSLLSRKKFPVRTLREFPSTALKLLSHSMHLLGPKTPNEQNSLYFSQLAGNFRATEDPETRQRACPAWIPASNLVVPA